MLIMTNDNTQINLPKRITEYYNKLTIKLHNTAASIGFIKKALCAHITPKFGQIKGQFVKDEEKHQVERRLMLNHISKHAKCLKEITKEHHEISGKSIIITGRLIFKCLLNKIIWTSKCKRMNSFITKNKKLDRLITCNPSITPDYNIPIINLSIIYLNVKELNQLKMGRDYSFLDKNKHVKKNIAASTENVVEAVVKGLESKKREDFHELLRAYTDIFSKNLYFSMDQTYSNLKHLIKDESIDVIPRDKDSAIVIMDKNDYVKKMKEMIDKRIEEGVYAKSEEKILQNLKWFQDFLCRDFNKYE